MFVIKKPVSLQWIKEDLMPFEESHYNVEQVLTSDAWICPCCSKVDCWESVTLPEEMDGNTEIEQCPAGAFIVGLARVWEVLPSQAIQILASVTLIDYLGVAVEPRLNLADRLTRSVHLKSCEAMNREGGFELPATVAGIHTELAPLKKPTKKKGKRSSSKG